VLIGFNFTGQRRSWAHQAHGSGQNVKQLGKFVEAVLSEYSPDTRDSWVVPYFEQQTIPLVTVGEIRKAIFGVDNHRAEFEHAEVRAFHPDTLLFEQHGTSAVDSDQDGHDRHEGRGYNYQDPRNDDVE
jgi:hypothetical protein